MKRAYEARTHYLRRNRRTTACGRSAKATVRDTRREDKVTCLVCLRTLQVWREGCEELIGSSILGTADDEYTEVTDKEDVQWR